LSIVLRRQDRIVLPALRREVEGLDRRRRLAAEAGELAVVVDEAGVVGALEEIRAHRPALGGDGVDLEGGSRVEAAGDVEGGPVGGGRRFADGDGHLVERRPAGRTGRRVIPATSPDRDAATNDEREHERRRVRLHGDDVRTAPAVKPLATPGSGCLDPALGWGVEPAKGRTGARGAP
jgi:hypothetical protein